MYLNKIADILVGRLQEKLLISLWQIGCNFFNMHQSRLRRHHTHRVLHVDASLDQACYAPLARFFNLLDLYRWIVRSRLSVNWHN
jgi:hypothetical protein